VNIQKFGDQKLYDYGLLEDQVPLFSRIDAGLVLGLRQDKNSGQVMDDLNKLSGRKTFHGSSRPAHKSAEVDSRYFSLGAALPSSPKVMQERL
jgi:hypothetical protein